MPHYAAFHLGLHYLLKYAFRSHYFIGLNKYIENNMVVFSDCQILASFLLVRMIYLSVNNFFSHVKMFFWLNQYEQWQIQRGSLKPPSLPPPPPPPPPERLIVAQGLASDVDSNPKVRIFLSTLKQQSSLKIQTVCWGTAKGTTWYVRPANTRISLHISTV